MVDVKNKSFLLQSGDVEAIKATFLGQNFNVLDQLKILSSFTLKKLLDLLLIFRRKNTASGIDHLPSGSKHGRISMKYFLLGLTHFFN